MPHAVFFDRDGIVNVRRPGDYVTRWSEFEFLPDIFTVLPRVRHLGALAIVATNQRGVALGRMTAAEVDVIHTCMQDTLRATCGTAFDDVLVCPHGDEAACDCRKPKPGLLRDAAARHDIDLAASWMIGDGERDVVAGNRAGCKSILVGPPAETEATFRCETLRDAMTLIEQHATTVRRA